MHACVRELHGSEWKINRIILAHLTSTVKKKKQKLNTFIFQVIPEFARKLEAHTSVVPN